MTIRNLAIITAVALSAPAYAGGNYGAPPPSSAHVHYCGCGHPGYVAPGCNGGGGTSGGWGGSSGNPGGGNPGGGNPGGGHPGTGNPGTNVPEPGDFALFALGVAGLLIGRRSARKLSTRVE